MGLLDGKLALITGGGGGLGGALAEGFAREGARVILADLDHRAAQAVAARLGAATAWAYALDVTDRVAVNAFAKQVQERHGAIDILINNAGISGRGKVDDAQAPDLWDRVARFNPDGWFKGSHAFVGQLKVSRGCIVNLSSIVAFVSGISTAGYVASKGAVRSLTQAMARDLAAHGVRVNAVAPGLMLTEMVRPQLETPGGTDWYMDRVPMKRGGEPRELVGPVVFLCSEMSSYVTGTVLPVDGGFLSA